MWIEQNYMTKINQKKRCQESLPLIIRQNRSWIFCFVTTNNSATSVNAGKTTANNLYCKRYLFYLRTSLLNTQRLFLTAESDISEIGYGTTAEIFLNLNPVLQQNCGQITSYMHQFSKENSSNFCHEKFCVLILWNAKRWKANFQFSCQDLGRFQIYIVLF